ncbi:hypothetical protein [Roseburia inulinivorans]|uniref:hypothetical protein n=1 Tax=Roseburia inulinivorans TaxID=360807 RepID=UPI001DF475D2|nr:hypothetical protein [Roseburia sp.]
MIGFPFDSHVTFESDGTPVYDRAITSAPLRKLIAKLLTDGVLPNPSTNLQVEAGSGMNVVVNPGFAICAGGLKLEENQRTLAIQAADSNYDRIDTVVLRWNDNDSERICDLYIVEGIPAASPLRPELTRTESIWELGLADLFINKNSSAISNQRITDTRYETARCGIISAISEFDTTTLYQQVQADLAGFKASEQADFIAWFDDIKGQLSEDAAGNLQKQIGTLEALKTEVKTNLVNALNWVVDKTSGVIAKLGSADISKIGDGTVTGAIVNNKEAIEDVSQSLTNIKKTYLRLVLPNVAADAKAVCDYINKNYLMGQITPMYSIEFDVVASNADWFSGVLSTDSNVDSNARTVWGIVQRRSISADNSTLYKYFGSGAGGAGTVSPFKSYDQGYAQGVTDADNRANANSTNYKTGYNNGYNAGKSDGALTGVSGCCIAGWRSIDAYSNNQWVSGWTGVNPNYFTVNGYGIVPKRNFTATVYWQGYNKRDIDFYSNGVMGHRDNGTSMNGVKMNFYAGTQCGFKTNDSGGGSLGAGFIVLN